MNKPRKYLIWEIYWNLLIVSEWKHFLSISGRKKRSVICKNLKTWKTRQYPTESISKWNTWNLKNNYQYTWTILYKKYQRLRERCNNKNHISYKNYWWRWIKCEWNSFEEFKNDMWDSYKDWLSVDRIDNNWNYCKGNCRWATRIDQSNNTRTNIYYTHNNKTQTLKQWCDELWLKYKTIFSRIKYSWYSFEKAISR